MARGLKQEGEARYTVRPKRMRELGLGEFYAALVNEDGAQRLVVRRRGRARDGRRDARIDEPGMRERMRRLAPRGKVLRGFREERNGYGSVVCVADVGPPS